MLPESNETAAGQDFHWLQQAEGDGAQETKWSKYLPLALEPGFVTLH